MNRIRLFASLCLLFVTQMAHAQSQNIRPVVKMAEVKPKREVFQAASRDKPLVLLNADSARKYFDQEAMKQLGKKVDFNKQVVMVFAWRGSGQDELRTSVLESFPEQLRIQYIRGRTRDLREHTAVFAVRSNVLWKGKPVRPAKMKNGESYIKVEIQGKLSRVFAIGGETTGYQIASKGITWELDFGNDQETIKLANSLEEKQVVVKGQLYSKKGVEIRQRTILKVESFRAAGESDAE